MARRRCANACLSHIRRYYSIVGFVHPKLRSERQSITNTRPRLFADVALRPTLETA
jgi:hypothetical protein